MLSRCSDYIPLFTKDEYIENREPHKQWRWKHKSCGHEFKSEYLNGFIVRCCPKCYDIHTVTSKQENEVVDFIRSIYKGTIFHRKYENRHLIPNTKEIDIILPELKLCIEYDGLYFHSSKFRTNNFHVHKTKECEKLGYRLIHIFEDEWIHQRKIVKNKLKHIIRKDHPRIFAKNCEVSTIDDTTKNAFMTKYHILGADHSKIRYCLKYRGRVVAMATIIKSRFSKAHQWELSRYATISNFVIVGGFGKLLSHFEREHKPCSIVAYSDKRWSNGDMFMKLGFRLIKATRPSKFYVYHSRRLGRLIERNVDISKDKLSKLHVIYDCGNLVFEKRFTRDH